jgi:hypothetical protein
MSSLGGLKSFCNSSSLGPLGWPLPPPLGIDRPLLLLLLLELLLELLELLLRLLLELLLLRLRLRDGKRTRLVTVSGGVGILTTAANLDGL